MGHRIRVAPSAKMSGRGLYDASCSCGRYRSHPTTRHNAVRSGVNHLFDKLVKRGGN